MYFNCILLVTSTAEHVLICHLYLFSWSIFLPIFEMDCLFYYFILKVLYVFDANSLFDIYLQIFSLSLLFHFCFLFLFILYRTYINNLWYDAIWYMMIYSVHLAYRVPVSSSLTPQPSLSSWLLSPPVTVGSNQRFSTLATLGVLFPCVVGD